MTFAPRSLTLPTPLLKQHVIGTGKVSQAYPNNIMHWLEAPHTHGATASRRAFRRLEAEGQRAFGLSLSITHTHTMRASRADPRAPQKPKRGIRCDVM